MRPNSGGVPFFDPLFLETRISTLKESSVKIQSKIIFILLAAMLWQIPVILAGYTQNAVNPKAQTAGDGTVKTVATNPAVSAPTVPASTTPGVLTGATKATTLPEGLPEYVPHNSLYMCPENYSCKIEHSNLRESICRLGLSGTRDCRQAAPLCTGFIDYGPNADPEDLHSGGNYQCPIGYGCHWNGPVLECRRLLEPIDGSPVVTFQGGPYCRAAFCGSVDNKR